MSKNKNKTVRIDYDRINDVLYISFGPQSPSYCVDEIDDVFIMKDIATDEYSGFKVLFFSERLQDGSLFNLELPFHFDFKQLEAIIDRTN